MKYVSLVSVAPAAVDQPNLLCNSPDGTVTLKCVRMRRKVTLKEEDLAPHVTRCFQVAAADCDLGINGPNVSGHKL